ncbi:MAG: hypothetical protein GTN80_09110 [Nitrososphaeria archaeon]|nr:hypothetical protein [Nitrososphaeria archaeon]NIN53325.1 hypothetical protein [Nitrososphaeria archaeon]NIQ33778.1 hypothetical protein [Nitrososphaeria archaeon]
MAEKKMHFLRDRRGISEVISAILIIMVAIAIGLGLFAYTTGVFGTTQSNFLLEAQTRKATVLERFVNTASYWNETDSSPIYFAIYNYGKREMTIAAIYVESEEKVPQFLDGDVTLKVDEIRWIKVGVPENDLDSYHIVVVSGKGNRIEFDFEKSQQV